MTDDRISAHAGPLREIAPAVFEQAVAQADIAISITDPEANIVYVNPAFARMTGYSAE